MTISGPKAAAAMTATTAESGIQGRLITEGAGSRLELNFAGMRAVRFGSGFLIAAAERNH